MNAPNSEPVKPSTTLTIPAIHSLEPANPPANHFLRLLGSQELVLVELQGSITRLDQDQLKLGKLVQEDDGRIYLVVGYQKLEGKVVDLKLPFAVLRQRHQKTIQADEMKMDTENNEEEEGGGEVEMEVVEVCRKKLYFGSRPEPMNEMES